MFPKNTNLILCIALLISFLVPCVSAEVFHPELVDYNHSIAYADLGLTGTQDVLVWQGATLIMTGNTTAGSMPQPIGDYMVVVKPQLTNRWWNWPPYLVEDFMSYLSAFIVPIFVICGLVAICLGLANYGRGH